MSIRLDWNNEQTDFEVLEAWISTLERLLELAGISEDVPAGVVSLSFVDAKRIHQLNKEYRGIDRPTDVLSFAMRESMDEEDIIMDDLSGDPAYEELLGDIIISLPTAKAQSEEYGHSFEREIGFLFVHGFLHLVGYDHQDDASEEAMFTKQEEILRKAGLVR